MTDTIVNYQAIRDALALILSSQVDDETDETVLALLDEAIAGHADELIHDSEVLGEAQVAVNEDAVTAALDYLAGVRDELDKSHTARTERINETIAQLQANVTTSDLPQC